MSKRVGIVGAGVTPFKGTWREKTYYELAQMATREAVKDAQIEISDVDAAFYGIYNDIFERTAIPEHAIHGLLGMQNGLRPLWYWVWKRRPIVLIFHLCRPLQR